MQAGDLTPNMIGNTHIRTRFQEATIEGRLNEITLDCEPARVYSRQSALPIKDGVDVTMGITVGQISMKEVPLKHEVLIIDG